jgi:hypothetical protein
MTMATTEAQRQQVRRDLDRDNRLAAGDRYRQRCICPHCHGRGCSKCS